MRTAMGQTTKSNLMEEMFASYFDCRNGFEFQVTSTWHIYRGKIISQLQKQNAIKFPGRSVSKETPLT